MRHAGLAAVLVAALGLADATRAEQPKPVTPASVADQCFRARADFAQALQALEAMGWRPARRDQAEMIGRVLAEFGHLGALRGRGGDPFDPAALAPRIAQLEADIPRSVPMLLQDFDGPTFVNVTERLAVLVLANPDRVLIMNMTGPQKVCGLFSTAALSEWRPVLERIEALERVLKQHYPKHEHWTEPVGFEGPMLAVDFHGVRQGTTDPYPSAHYYVLRPAEIAKHTDYVFWTRQVFAFFLQEMP